MGLDQKWEAVNGSEEHSWAGSDQRSLIQLKLDFRPKKIHLSYSDTMNMKNCSAARPHDEESTIRQIFLEGLWTLLVATAVMNLTGCASSDGDRGLASGSFDDESRAHPASYLVDRFPVNRPLPQHENKSQVEFYFKKCDMVGERWPDTRTSYDCNYP